MSNQVRTQNLRECTVQIRNIKTNAIVGTGVVVSIDGKIVTCGHVVAAAGVNPRLGKDIPVSWNIFKNILGGDADPSADGEVAVYFPLAREGETKERRATVIGCFHQHDDDVVLLQLIGGPAPVGEEHVAKLGRAEESEDTAFAATVIAAWRTALAGGPMAKFWLQSIVPYEPRPAGPGSAIF